MGPPFTWRTGASGRSPQNPCPAAIRIFAFMLAYSRNVVHRRRHGKPLSEQHATRCHDGQRSHICIAGFPVSPRLRADHKNALNYCGGVVVGAVAPVFALPLLLCFRGLLPVPAVPNENVLFSPGTLVSVTRLPIFRTRRDTAGKAGGGLRLGVGG